MEIKSLFPVFIKRAVLMRKIGKMGRPPKIIGETTGRLTATTSDRLSKQKNLSLHQRKEILQLIRKPEIHTRFPCWIVSARRSFSVTIFFYLCYCPLKINHSNWKIENGSFYFWNFFCLAITVNIPLRFPSRVLKVKMAREAENYLQREYLPSWHTSRD